VREETLNLAPLCTPSLLLYFSLNMEAVMPPHLFFSGSSPEDEQYSIVELDRHCFVADDTELDSVQENIPGACVRDVQKGLPCCRSFPVPSPSSSTPVGEPLLPFHHLYRGCTASFGRLRWARRVPVDHHPAAACSPVLCMAAGRRAPPRGHQPEPAQLCWSDPSNPAYFVFFSESADLVTNRSATSKIRN
jgi:hypothetical protein